VGCWQLAGLAPRSDIRIEGDELEECPEQAIVLS